MKHIQSVIAALVLMVVAGQASAAVTYDYLFTPLGRTTTAGGEVFSCQATNTSGSATTVSFTAYDEDGAEIATETNISIAAKKTYVAFGMDGNQWVMCKFKVVSTAKLRAGLAIYKSATSGGPMVYLKAE